MRLSGEKILCKASMWEVPKPLMADFDDNPTLRPSRLEVSVHVY